MSKRNSRKARPDWLIVARREFVERVRSKWFIIVTLLGPVGLAALLVVPAWLEAKSAETEVTIQIIDRTPQELSQSLLQYVPKNYHVELVESHIDRDEMTERIRREEIDGFLLLPEDTFTGGTVIYEGANTSNVRLMMGMQVIINLAVVRARASEAGISDMQIAGIMQPVSFTWEQNTGEAEASSRGPSALIAGYVVLVILYMSILLYAVNVMRSVVQEKTNRVVEIMISAVRPRDLMLGKILGVGSVGLLQLLIWALMALVLLEYRGQILGLIGITGASEIEVPSLEVADLIVVLVYFFTGYFFYASLYAAVGAMVNSDQEAQQVQTPVVLLLIIPVLCASLVATDPRGTAAEVLTLVPFSSPVLMPMRYLLGGATLGDVGLSLAVLLLCMAGAVLLAGRIYRVGILMYGKRPSLGELARWLRYQ